MRGLFIVKLEVIQKISIWLVTFLLWVSPTPFTKAFLKDISALNNYDTGTWMIIGDLDELSSSIDKNG